MKKRSKPAKKANPEPGYVEHLEELRASLLAVILFFAAAFAACFIFVDKIMLFLQAPIAGTGVKLSYFSPHEKFMAYLKVAFFSGVFVTVPFAIAVLAAFIRPALKRDEKGYFYAAVTLVPVLFLSGCAFAFYIITPAAFRFFTGFAAGDNVAAFWGIGAYFNFVVFIIFATGCIFLVPMLLLMLMKMGIVDPAVMAKARPYLIVGVFITAGVITPSPDAVTQVLVALPLWGLFELSIFFGKILFK